MGLPPRSWQKHESGVAMPAQVIFRFIALTGADPVWLLTGQGDRYLSGRPTRPAPRGGPAGRANGR
jgi:hypothetical protein